MEYTNAVILPHILEALSRKPKLCDTYDNLCNEIEIILIAENGNGNGKQRNIRKNINKALHVAQSLGIITLTNETIRIPFNLRSNAKKYRAPRLMASAEDQFDDCDDLSSFDNRRRDRSPQRRRVYDFKHLSNATDARMQSAFKAFAISSNQKETSKNPRSRSKHR